MSSESQPLSPLSSALPLSLSLVLLNAESADVESRIDESIFPVNYTRQTSPLITNNILLAYDENTEITDVN